MARYFDWVVFTSPNAVRLFFEEYFKYQSDIRGLGRIRFAALGPATAAHLRALHLHVDLEPKIYTVEKLTEELLKEELAGVRFCLPHGNLADPNLAHQLRERGALVEEWTLYETQPETDDVGGARARFLKEGAHWITFTSSSTVRNWHALQLEPAAGAPRPRAVSLGPVTSTTLRELGYDVAAEAPVSTIDSLIETLSKLNIESTMPTNEELMEDGDTALAIGELEQAADCFRQAVEQDPNFQDGWHAYGMALYKLERYVEAIEAGKRAALLDPNNQFRLVQPLARF